MANTTTWMLRTKLALELLQALVSFLKFKTENKKPSQGEIIEFPIIAYNHNNYNNNRLIHPVLV